MQTAILDQTSKTWDHAAINVLHEQDEILSVTVRKGTFARSSNSQEQGAFWVVDLLEDVSYFVSAFEDRQELIFSAKQEYIVVTLTSSCDATKIADLLANQLDIITAAN